LKTWKKEQTDPLKYCEKPGLNPTAEIPRTIRTPNNPKIVTLKEKLQSDFLFLNKQQRQQQQHPKQTQDIKTNTDNIITKMYIPIFFKNNSTGTSEILEILS
jgi:hypothetical protein